MNLDHYETKCAAVISPEDESILTVCLRDRHHDGPHLAILARPDGTPRLLFVPNDEQRQLRGVLLVCAAAVLLLLGLLAGAAVALVSFLAS